MPSAFGALIALFLTLLAAALPEASPASITRTLVRREGAVPRGGAPAGARQLAAVAQHGQGGLQSISNRWMTLSNATEEGSLDIKPKRIRLFCFAWTVRHRGEEQVLPEIRKQMAGCDGYTIFTDQEALGPAADDIVKVAVPVQDRPRHGGQDNWLYHRNMAGIMQAWTHLFDRKLLDEYDWVINTEFDHFMRPTQVRRGIAEYLKNLWRGTSQEKLSVGKAMMLMWGNVYVFNSEMVHEMHRQWPVLGRTVGAGHPGSGCPDWMDGHSFWPGECAQDIVYPIMTMVMTPHVHQVGAAGCGQQPRNHRGMSYLLPCYQLDQNPMPTNSGAENAALALIHALAENRTDEKVFLAATAALGPMLLGRDFDGGADLHASRYAAKFDTMLSSARAFSDSFALKEALVAQLERYRRELASQRAGTEWELFFPDVHVPIWHQVKWPSVHALGRELLGL